MKKFIFIMVGLFFYPLLIFGQNLGIGLGVGAGTLGFGGEVIVAPSPKITLRGGLSALPLKLNFSSRVNIPLEDYSVSGDIDWTDNKTLLSGHLISDFRFSNNSIFFLSVGLLLGKTEMDFEGILQDNNQIPSQYFPVDVSFEDEYLLRFDKSKTVNIDVVWKQKIKPYFGIGLGSPYPKSRVGVKFELGVAYQGNYKATSDQVVQGDLGQLAKKWKDFERYEKWLSFYPVARLQLIVRLF